jgi:hypothetical protein
LALKKKGRVLKGYDFQPGNGTKKKKVRSGKKKKKKKKAQGNQ